MENLVAFISLTVIGKLISSFGIKTSFLAKTLYYVFIPLLLFVKLVHFNCFSDINYNYISIYIISIVIISLCSVLFTKFSLRSSFVILPLISTFMNTSFLGLPIIEALFENPISGIIVNTIQVTIIGPILFILLDIFSKKNHKFNLLFILKMIFNPIAVAPILAILLSRVYPTMPMPLWLENFVFFIPYLAIIYFGAELKFKYFNIRNLTYNSRILIFLKQIMFPLTILILEKTFFKLEGYWLYSLLILSITPPANVVPIVARDDSLHSIEAQQVTIFSSCILIIGILILLTYKLFRGI